MNDLREPWEMDSFLQHESTMKSMKSSSGKGRPPVNNGGCVMVVIQALLIVAAVAMVIF